MKIIISGSLMSGRTVFLDKLLTDENSRNNFKKNVYSLSWKFNDRSFDLEIMKAKFSRGDYYLNRINYQAFPDVQDEINFIRELDGIVFVIDSQKERIEAGVYDLRLLEQGLKDYGRNINEIPIVFSVNKRDLPNIRSIDEIKKEIFSSNCIYVESISTQGIGVTSSINELVNLIWKSSI